jgi:hypothetical protein
MPLLPQEPCLYPESLLSTPAGNEDLRWWVLHTKPRTEKSLARRLRGKEIAFFLPLYHRQWRSSGRLRDAFLPLFPGYLFLLGDADARRRALETNLVLRTLLVSDQRQLEHDLKRVHQMVEHGSGLTPEDRLRPGTRVEIISGPLAGMHGTILRRRNRFKFYVEIHLLQQGVSAEIESWMFRPLGSSRSLAV